MHLYCNPFGKILQNFLRISERKYYSTASKKCRDKTSKVMRDKVAIITGGACGLGCEFVRECLKKGAAGVTIADVNFCDGLRVAKQFCEEFGKGRCMYVQCDVTKSELLDWTFKQTLKCFGQVDLLVNNAGMLNDMKWEHCVATNIGGCVIGSLLAIQYMSKACIGNGGTVINISSVYGITPLCGLPIYSMTQAAIIAFSKSLGEGNQYDRTGVKIVNYCIGPTDTPLLESAPNCTMNDRFKVELLEELEGVKRQSARTVAKGISKLISRARTGSIWVACNGCPPFEIALPEDIDDLKV